VPEQLTFSLAGAPAATFETFVPGRNVEAIDALMRFARNVASETGLVIWGSSGAGRTHLLKSVVDLAQRSGLAATYVESASQLDDAPFESDMLVAIDDVDRADDTAQARLFTLYNTLAARRAHLVAAASVPPAAMPLRDDLRTRLAWGLVIEIVPLADEDKPDALEAFARARGFRLEREAIAYLLAHGRRDMPSLVRALIALDQRSLALQRPISVPLIREWMQHELALARRESR
jgi:DnaA family protein